LLPKDPWQRAKVREVVETVNSGIQPLQNATVVARIGDSQAQKIWVEHFLTKGLLALESLAKANNSHDYMFEWSSNPTLAEVYLVPQVFNARRYGINLQPYPRIHRIFDHLTKNVDGFGNTMPPTSQL